MFDWAFYKTPKLIQTAFPSFTWKVDTKEKVIYPTFDDGPIPLLTKEILSILDDFEAKATFFCVGENISKYPEIFESILSKKHSIGNHTYNHLKAWKTPEEDYFNNIYRCQNEIEKFGLPHKKLFRPPYGQLHFKYNKRLREEGYQSIMWDVLSKDYDISLSSDTVLKNIKRYSTNGSIIVFHDNFKAKDKILQFLPLYLQHFSDIGYKFKKL